VAAVLAAVAGSVAVATYQASEDRQHRDEYVPSVPYGMVTLQSGDYDGIRAPRPLTGLISDVEKHLPVTGRADVSQIPAYMETPKANVCPRYTPKWERLSDAQKWRAAESWKCGGNLTAGYSMIFGGPVIGGPDVLRALQVKDPQAFAALRRGEAVAFDRKYLQHGEVSFSAFDDYREARKAQGTGKPAGRKITLPAHLLRGQQETYGMTVLIPPAAVRERGYEPKVSGAYFTTDRLPTEAEQQALDGAFAERDESPSMYVERGYHSSQGGTQLALTVFAGLVTLGAAAIATSLAQADAGPDLRTLTAVGAAPRVRRTLSGLQCGAIAAMGVVLGTVAGLVPAIGLRKAEEHRDLQFFKESFGNGWGGPPHAPVAVPWTSLAALLVVVPLGAALLATLATRSQSGALRGREG
jgi:putative ABC transport system permease protein